MARTKGLVTLEEEIRGFHLARKRGEDEEFGRLIDSVRQRIISFVAESAQLRNIVGDNRYRVLGADFRVDDADLKKRGTLPAGTAVVGIYDYDRDVLLSVVVNLRRGDLIKVEEHPGVQPPPSLEEEQDAAALALNDYEFARRTRGKRLETVVLPAREASAEEHPCL